MNKTEKKQSTDVEDKKASDYQWDMEVEKGRTDNKIKKYKLFVK